jgi:hypothetical protein
VNTWDDEDRAIARALDVPFDDDGPVDERALEDYRRVVAELPVEAVAPPRGLEERTIAAALERRPASVRSVPAARAHEHRRRSRVRLAALGAVAVAAAVVGAVLVSTRDTSTDAGLRGQLVPVASTGAHPEALRRTAGARVGTFGGGGGVVLAPDGRGALFDLVTTSTVVVELVAAEQTAIGSSAPVDGAIAFSVEHPERVVAIRLSFPNGREIASARLSPG